MGFPLRADGGEASTLAKVDVEVTAVACCAASVKREKLLAPSSSLFPSSTSLWLWLWRWSGSCWCSCFVCAMEREWTGEAGREMEDTETRLVGIKGKGEQRAVVVEVKAVSVTEGIAE